MRDRRIVKWRKRIVKRRRFLVTEKKDPRKSRGGGGGGGVAPPTYAINMVDFDGSSYLSRAYGSAEGVNSGPEGVLSLWAELDTSVGDRPITDLCCSTVGLLRTSSNALRFYLYGAVNLVDVGFDEGIADLQRFHLAFAWNLVGDAPIFQSYMDGVAISPASVITAPTAGNVSYDRPFNATLLGGNEFGGRHDGRLGDLFFDTSFLDLSVPANLAKFITPAGDPVYMGDTAQLPTGTQAKVAFSGNAAHWSGGDGRGSVGGWELTGGLTDAPS